MADKATRKELEERLAAAEGELSRAWSNFSAIRIAGAISGCYSYDMAQRRHIEAAGAVNRAQRALREFDAKEASR